MASLTLPVAAAHAQPQDERYVLEINEPTLGGALKELSEQTGQLLLFKYELIGVRGVRPLSGSYTVSEALNIMLQGTGFSGRRTASGVITISMGDPQQSLTTENDMTRGKQVGLLSGASALLLGLLGIGGPAYGQETGADPSSPSEDESVITVQDITVTGIRRSLQSAQDIRRNAPTVVDSITASDIGALPDRSVTEALQRVPGVAISRFARGSDSDRFSVEGSGVLIRGLDRVRTELNGRDIFSATNGRGLSFEDVPSELLFGVDVYKNQTADMIEGGIAGTVSLRTRVPFDAQGRVIAGSADYSYGDLREEWTPSFSGLISDRWETRIGEFGVLINASTSELKSQSHAIQLEPHFKRADIFAAQAGAGAATTCSVLGDFDQDSSTPNTEGPCFFVPRGFGARMTDYDRERKGYAFAGQWRSTDRRWLATYQYNRTEGNRDFLGRYLTFDEDGSSQSIVPPEGQSLGFDQSGTFANGTLLANSGWRAYDPRVNPSNQLEQFQGGGGLYGQWHSAGSEIERNRFVTEDHSVSVRYSPTERLHLNFEAQHVKSEVDFLRFNPELWFYAVPTVDARGERPSVTAAPVDGRPNFLDPAQYWWNKVQFGQEDNEGEEDTFRFDAEYDVEAGIVKSIEAGGRFAKRDQVTNSQYSVGFVGPPWGCCNDGEFPGFWPGPELSNAAWADRFFAANPPTAPAGSNPPQIAGGGTIYDLFAATSRGRNETEVFTFDNFFRGDISSPGTFLFPGASMYGDPFGSSAALGALAARIRQAHGFNNFVALQDLPASARVDDINQTSEETQAFYVKVNFEQGVPLFGRRLLVDGNVGVRWVKTETAASGVVALADATSGGFTGRAAVCSITSPTPVQAAQALTDPTCILSANDVAFATPGTIPAIDNDNEYENILPSLNLKVGLTDRLLLRFAASKAVNRPDLGLLRNFVQIRPGGVQGINAQGQVINQVNTPNCAGPSGGFQDPSAVPAECVPTTARFFDTTSGLGFGARAFGNPQLEAEEAINLDFAVEWYFADVGSVTATLFSKKISNYLGSEVLLQSFTNNGVTQQVAINRPFNGEEGKIKGFEIAYQQFYEFLPGPLSGLGLQLNYTYVDNESVPIASLQSDGGLLSDNGGRIDEPSPQLPLPGLSKDTWNVAVLYEKFGIEGRLAYNWRSPYLLTPFDTGALVTPVFHDEFGQLDGSLFYAVSEHWKVGLQAVNLLDAEARTEIPPQALNQSTGQVGAVNEFDRLFPRSYFVSDRRISVIVRATF